jgi:hypothetical protein
MKNRTLYVTVETWLFVGCQQHIARASVYTKVREKKVRERE